VSRRLALIIGNSVYRDNTLARLLKPDADVGNLAEIMLDAEVGGFDDVNVLVNMSFATVRREVASFFSKKQREDLLVLYFSGHGILDDAGRLYLAVKDTERNLLRGTAIPAAFITDEMNNSRSRRQILILDCCHSGAFARGMKGGPGTTIGTGTVFEGTGFGRVVLTATDAIQYAWEGDQVIGDAENSVFTHYLIKGLQTGEADVNGDGEITVDELYDYMYAEIVKQTPKQTPSKWSYRGQGNIVVANNPHRKKEPEAPITLPEVYDELEKRLEKLYAAGLSAFWLEEWDKAVRCFLPIVDVRPDYKDVAEKLTEAKRQQKYSNLYQKGLAAIEVEKWSEGISILEILMAEAPDFMEAATILARAKEQKNLADLYAEAQHLFIAEKWHAVIKVFDRIATIMPGHKDPEKLLSRAKEEAGKQQRLERLEKLYIQALEEINAGKWQQARGLLTEVQEEEQGFQETERLLKRVESEIAREEGEQRQQEQISTLYEQALKLAAAGQWQQSQKAIKEIKTLDPQFADPEELASRAQEEVERQRRLKKLYAQAQAAQEGEDWSGALSALEKLVAEAADYRDATDLLEAVRKQKQLTNLYGKAQRLHQKQQWQAVIDTFAQISAIEPDYPDPEELLTAAKQEEGALKRQAELNDLYNRAVREVDAENWTEARQLLAQLEGMKPNFRETERLLTRVEAEIEQEETNRKRQEQTATLYEQALGLARAQQWRQVLVKMEEIHTLDPEFTDLEGLAAKGQEKVTGEEEEARRQNELAALYAEAVHLLKAGKYQETLEKWGEVRAREPRYHDRQKVQAKARKKLEALAEGALPRRGMPRWAIAAIGGFVVVAIVAAVAVLRSDYGSAPKPTPTIALIAAGATDTPSHTTSLEITPTSLTTLGTEEGEPIGQNISLYEPPEPGIEFPAREPFHIQHGWYEIQDPLQLGLDFELQINGILRDEDYLLLNDDRSGDEQRVIRRWLHNFPDGMVGTHIFTAHWIAPCQWAVDNTEFPDTCSTPGEKVEVIVSSLTVDFIP
jgi:outer membrane protein assembly factor BamD (BamD/ComL family)